MIDRLKWWWRGNGDDTISLIKFIFICIFVVYLVLGTGNLLIKQSCKNGARVMQVEYHYGFFEGCFYELNGDFFPSDQYLLVKNLEEK